MPAVKCLSVVLVYYVQPGTSVQLLMLGITCAPSRGWRTAVQKLDGGDQVYSAGGSPYTQQSSQLTLRLASASPPSYTGVYIHSLSPVGEPPNGPESICVRI